MNKKTILILGVVGIIVCLLISLLLILKKQPEEEGEVRYKKSYFPLKVVNFKENPERHYSYIYPEPTFLGLEDFELDERVTEEKDPYYCRLTGGGMVFWSPDGSKIALAKNCRLGIVDLEKGFRYLISLENEREQPVPLRYGLFKLWGKNAETLIFLTWPWASPVIEHNTISLNNIKEGMNSVLVEKIVFQLPFGFTYGAISPDGQKIAFSRDNGELVIFDFVSQRSKILLKGVYRGYRETGDPYSISRYHPICWTPDNKYLFILDTKPSTDNDKNKIILIDPHIRDVLGRLKFLTKFKIESGTFIEENLIWSPDNSKFYLRDTDFIYSLDGKKYKIEAPVYKINHFLWTADDDFIIVDNNNWIFFFKNNNLVEKIRIDLSIDKVNISPEKKFIILDHGSASGINMISLFNLENKKIIGLAFVEQLQDSTIYNLLTGDIEFYLSPNKRNVFSLLYDSGPTVLISLDEIYRAFNVCKNKIPNEIERCYKDYLKSSNNISSCRKMDIPEIGGIYCLKKVFKKL